MTDQVQRLCLNCACHMVQENHLNPLEKQSFCRRDPPMAQQMRVSKPMMRDGKPVIDKHNNKPLMKEEIEIIYLYRPTMPNLVCFDGWRPTEYQPGERMPATLEHDIGDLMADGYKRLMADLQTDSLNQTPHWGPWCEHDIQVGQLCQKCPNGIARLQTNG